jgi:hypothetical protein
LQQLKQKWEDLDTPQKGYAVVVGLLTLAALPRVLTLLVLGLERILIGGLLAVEEVLLQVLFKGGALVSELRRLGVLHIVALSPYHSTCMHCLGTAANAGCKVVADLYTAQCRVAPCTPCLHVFHLSMHHAAIRLAKLLCCTVVLKVGPSCLQVGAVGVVGLVLAGVYLFLVPKTTK